MCGGDVWRQCAAAVSSNVWQVTGLDSSINAFRMIFLSERPFLLLDGCCINTDKQELQQTEHYYSNILGFILVGSGGGDCAHYCVDPMAVNFDLGSSLISNSCCDNILEDCMLW